MKRRPHKFVRVRTFHWLVCTHCGLVALRNERTERAIKEGCIDD